MKNGSEESVDSLAAKVVVFFRFGAFLDIPTSLR
jgi:hypothetical protein